MLTPYRRALTTTVNDIEHIEANSLPGIGVVKIYFQPGADVRLANAQITAVSQTLLRQMPSGTTPPLVLNYNASTVPIVQLALAGQGLSEQNLFDYGVNFIRRGRSTATGACVLRIILTRPLARQTDGSAPKLLHAKLHPCWLP
ncbi:efflux RND transporter permease subunit, partial [Caulobacter hibisci]|nr:efflux RND transporter permease subunit [Caulobacter hibisci]